MGGKKEFLNNNIHLYKLAPFEKWCQFCFS